MLGFDASSAGMSDNQSGIGALLGVGAKINFNGGFSVFVNPYLKMHALLPFSSSKYRERLGECGIRLGVNFDLK